MPALLVLLSAAICLVSGWMGTMYLILHHPYYLERAGMSLVIFVGAAAAAAGGWRGPIAVRPLLGVWAAALLAVGPRALLGNRGGDRLGLVAGLLFVAEGAVL